MKTIWKNRWASGPDRLVYRLIIALTIVLSLASEVRATTIVGFWTPGSLAIAADSTGIFRRIGRPEGTTKVCKIFIVQGTAFAVGGLTIDRKREYDVEQVIAEIAWNRFPIGKTIALLEERLKKIVLAEMEAVRKDDPAFYSRIITGEEGVVTSFLLATIEEGKPFAVGVSFQVRELSNGALELIAHRKQCPGDCEGGATIFKIGEQGPINSYLQKHGAHFRMSPAAAAEFLVQQVIDAMPEKVGPPVDVLEVSPAGFSWLKKKEECGGSPDGFRAPNTKN